MPNFKCKTIKQIVLPYTSNGVEFLWMANGENVDLIYTVFEKNCFFLQIKKDENAFLIKGEKHTKPSQIGYLQKALIEFKNSFCDEIINEAVALKSTRLVKKSSLIASDLKDLLLKIQNHNKIFIEIGFGSGRHLLYQAKNNTDTLVIGVEIYTPALEQVAKLAFNESLQNILLIQTDARLLLSVLESNLIDKIFLHFPVPWDKKPHRRVMGENFANECARVLKENGKFELRTDSYLYFEFSLNVFLKFNHLKALIKKNENLEISSKYEDRWKRQNKDIYDLSIGGFEKSDKLQEMQNFSIEELKLNKDDLCKIKSKFKNQTIKDGDYFLHLERLYIADDKLITKIAFGAFYKPEHVYISFANEGVRILFAKPFQTVENLKALEKLREIIYFYIK